VQAITTQLQIQEVISRCKAKNQRIGFVPTMGALHEGHLSLIDFALGDCDLVVVSIFVNPTQFNRAEDLKNYPRTLASDLALLAPYKHDIIVYAPSPEEVYKNGVVSKSYRFGALETVMEGAHRPGHFDGVGTVLNLLFRQINPDKAYFGEKDYQQLLIVKKLVQKERLDIDIVGCPIHRQDDGLALSSRNARLTPAQLQAAPFIYQTLLQVKKDFGTKSARTLKEWVTAQFAAREDLELEYFEIANIDGLRPLSRKRNHQKYRAFLAVYAGPVRLIDNMALNY
jgi:pantoate--beta-alanine ligase